MATVFNLITLNTTDISSVNDAYIESTKQQIALNTSLEALYTEIDLTADIVYLSYNTLRRSTYSIKVFDCQILFYELVNKLSFNIKLLSEGFSHILAITGESYNKYEDHKLDIEHIIKFWKIIDADELNDTIAPDIAALKAEDENEVLMTFELLMYIFKNLSIQLEDFNDTVESLMMEYNNIQIADTNLKDTSSQESYGLAFKFYIYTRCIDAILRKYLVVSTNSSQKISELISTKHLTISEASEQLIELTANLKHKWSNKFH